MYALTALFWYKLVFMTELLIAESLTAHRLKRRKHFAPRLLLSIVCCYGVAAAIPIVTYNALYCSFMFVTMFAATFFGMFACFKESPLNILFCALAGYTTQHIAYELYDLSILGITGGKTEAFSAVYGESAIGMMPISINMGAFQSRPNPLFFMIYFFIYGIIYLLSYLFTSSRLVKYGELSLKSTAIVAFSGLFFLFNILVSAIVIYRSRITFDFAYIAMLQVYNIFSCFVIMYLMFETALRHRLETEVNIVQSLWAQDRKQFALAKENINYINIKCHDLKHQIRTIGSRNEIDGNTVSELENVISIYDSDIKTGNAALDVILTEKSIYCSRNGIELDCMADGTAFGFMKDDELYSLFGNIIDNAIEAVQTLKESRRIDLSVRTVNGGFVKIFAANKFNVKPRFGAGGLPVTTKADKVSHGFGMKSVKYICDKYDGSMSVNADSGLFELTIVFAKPSLSHTD